MDGLDHHESLEVDLAGGFLIHYTDGVYQSRHIDTSIGLTTAYMRTEREIVNENVYNNWRGYSKTSK